MTRLLEQALQAVEKLLPQEQDAIAALILEEIDDEQHWEMLSLVPRSSPESRGRFARTFRRGTIRDARADELAAAERTFDPYRIAKILQLAVREALLRHKQAGNPIAVWRDGRVEWIQPEDIPVDGPEDRSEE